MIIKLQRHSTGPTNICSPSLRRYCCVGTRAQGTGADDLQRLWASLLAHAWRAECAVEGLAGFQGSALFSGRGGTHPQATLIVAYVSGTTFSWHKHPGMSHFRKT